MWQDNNRSRQLLIFDVFCVACGACSTYYAQANELIA